MDFGMVSTNTLSSWGTTKGKTKIKGYTMKFSASGYMNKIARSESKTQVLALIKLMRQDLKRYCNSDGVSQTDMLKANEAAKMVESNGNKKVKHLEKERQQELKNKLEEKIDSVEEINKKREKLVRKKCSRKQQEAMAVMDVAQMEQKKTECMNNTDNSMNMKEPGGFDVVCDGIDEVVDEANIDMTV